jgi:hypothetical protein
MSWWYPCNIGRDTGMKCIQEIQEAAWSKLEDAECLFEGGRYDAAFYLAGYTIELLLKALICKNLGIEDFFNFEDSERKYLSREAYRPFKVHDYEQLITLSGYYASFKIEKQNEDFLHHWSLVNPWSENYRYLSGKKREDVKKFLTSIRIIGEWIETNL